MQMREYSPQRYELAHWPEYSLDPGSHSAQRKPCLLSAQTDDALPPTQDSTTIRCGRNSENDDGREKNELGPQGTATGRSVLSAGPVLDASGKKPGSSRSGATSPGAVQS